MAIEENDNDDFAKGFAAASGGTPPEPPAVPAAAAPEAPVVETPAPAASATPEPTDPPPAAAVPANADADLLDKIADEADELLPGYTREQVASLLAQIPTVSSRFDKVSGHIGTLLQEVKAMKEGVPTQAPAASASPAMTDAQLQQFQADYPDFATAAQKIAAQSGASPEQIKAQVNEAIAGAVAQIELRQELRIMAMQHADWENVVHDNAYQLWLATQPAETQASAKSDSAVELSKVLTAYKGFAAQQADRAKARQNSQRRLAGNLVPEGVPAARPAELTEDEAFKAGFAAVANR